MKKILVAVIGLLCASSLMVSAQDTTNAPANPPAKTEKPHHKAMTPEQKAEYKELVAKYDTNKDGHLDKEERAKMTQEDKDKMAALTGPKKKAE